MNLGFLTTLLQFIILCMAQVLVLNNIHLFNIATPLLYVYMVLNFRRNYSKAGILLWCFAMGLIIDAFSNTPGMATAAMTALGFIQPSLLEAFIPRDSADEFQPSMKTLGTSSYIYYTGIITFVYCIIYFSLEMFNFFNILFWAECVVGSTALTLLTIIAIAKVSK